MIASELDLATVGQRVVLQGMQRKITADLTFELERFNGTILEVSSEGPWMLVLFRTYNNIQITIFCSPSSEVLLLDWEAE